MAFDINAFRSNMIGDGARPNLFEVNLNFPNFALGNGDASQQIPFMAKTSQLPGATTGIVPVYYFGRELKFAGNRTFTDWTVQIINDENFTIRKALEQWMNSVNSNAGNLRDINAVEPSQYSSDAYVTQFGKTGGILKQYRFVGLFPIDIAPIDLDWGSNDVVEEYSVTFAYQWWESMDGTTT